MAKIGILTYHRADNFGAQIQAYALSKYLLGIGHQVEIIDYRCRRIEVNYDILSPRILISRKNILLSFKEYIDRFRTLEQRRRRRLKFIDFRKKLPISRKCKSIKAVDKYDVIISGSDQVWNFYINRGCEDVYLLNFTLPQNTKRIAYAASSELNGIKRIDINVLKYCLQRFDKISVRERFLADYIHDKTGMNVDLCLDPSFLLSKGEYLRIAIRPKFSSYILVYHMTPISDILSDLKTIAQTERLQIVEVFGGFSKNEEFMYSDWGPSELLGLIADAEMVLTTSFHGLALSLIMQKNVWVVNKGDNLRQQNILEQLGLEHRMIKRLPDNCLKETIDYSVVEDKLNDLITKSKRFLDLDMAE